MVISDLPGVQTYLNDAIVSKKKGDNGARIKVALERFREQGTKLRYDKARFRQSAVIYLGHRIENEGLHPIEKNVEAIMRAPQPRNLRERRSFIGMLTFYAKLLSNMSACLAPLYQLLGKNARWQWKAPQEAAFNTAKERLKKPQMFVHFDPTQELKQGGDISSLGIGAVFFILSTT